MIYDTRIDGFPVTNISVHVIAPAREITTSEAAYAISSSCKNLHKKEHLKLSESVNQPSTEDKTCNAEENGIDMPENRS
jgi:hypothetical protein